jgi:hypothetical protein
MSGTTAVTQTVLQYVCQTTGTGSLQLNALDSIDPNEIADGAYAQVEAGDQLWKWYQNDATAPGPSVVVPIIPLTLTPLTGRWILQSGVVPPGVFYQYILNNPLNTALAPVNLPLVSPAQAPNLRFQNMSSAGSTGVETVITAFYQQVTFEDASTGLTTVEIQRPRLKLVQEADMGATAGEILTVADDAALEATVATFYRPAYQTVNGFRSPVLNFVGTPVLVTDAGGVTTVTISTAAALAGWDQVLAAGNTSAGGGAGNLPTVNSADVFTITDSAHMFLDSGAYIEFERPQNLLVWSGTSIADGATITYAGAGGAPAGAALRIVLPDTPGGDTGAVVDVFSGAVTAGGGFQVTTGDGVTSGATGGDFAHIGGTSVDDDGGRFMSACGDGAKGGYYSLRGGEGTAGAGGGLVFNGGVGSTSGGGWYLTMGDGTASDGGGFEVITGAGAVTKGGPVTFRMGTGEDGGDFDIVGGLGTVRGSNITFASGAVAGSGGATLQMLGAVVGGGSGLTFQAGNGVASGGGITFTLGNASAGSGGGLSFFGGTSTSPNTGGGVAFTMGYGHIGGGLAVDAAAGVIQGGDIRLTSGACGANAGATLQVLGGLTGGPKGYVSINSWVYLQDESPMPPPNPTGGGYLFSYVSGGVSTLYWKQGATARAVALV